MSACVRQKNILAILLGVALGACSLSVATSTPTIGTTAALIPYQTPTLVQVPTSDSGAELSLPTPTPATYVVVEGDTFFTIAARFEIDLDALMAANPGVDPRLLKPGTTLTLPSAGGPVSTGIPTPTPVALTIADPDCYSTTAGELWCLLNVENPLPVNVENPIAAVQLLSADGEVIATVETTPPLNLLPAGESMPLVAFVSDPPQGWVMARGQLLTAFALGVESDYYLAANIQGVSIDILDNGLAAKMQGSVEVQGGEAKTIWVLAVAYDGSGSVVGFRRWESEGETEFDFMLYSLGPKIVDTKLLVEARP